MQIHHFRAPPPYSPKVCPLGLYLEILHAENLQVERIEVLRQTGPVSAGGKQIGCRTPSGQVLNGEERSLNCRGDTAG